MKKRRILKKAISLALSTVLCFSATACDFESILSDIKDAASDVGDYFKELYEKFDDWWDGASKDLGLWWDEASNDIESWWDETLETGQDVFKAIEKKFKELSDYLLEEKNKLVDTVITNIATKTYENAQADLGLLEQSSETFCSVSELNLEDENVYDYDMETFVYRLIDGMFPVDYETFPAYVLTDDGDAVCGFAYTDYKTAYKNSDCNYYAAGFIAYADEQPLMADWLHNGKVIYPFDELETGKTAFLFSYMPESYKTHCVALNKYFTFGVNEYGQIEYTCEDFDENAVDGGLGSLYSFDENKVIMFKNDESYFTDSPFLQELAYANRSVEEIKKDIYSYLGNFTLDFSSLDMEEIFYTAKENVENILEKNDISNYLANTSIEDVFTSVDFAETPPQSASNLEKWLLGTSCVVTCIGSVAVSTFIPQISPVLGAITGASVEAFSETVISNRSISSLDYRKLLLSSVSGAISSKMGVLGDSVVGGLTDGAFSLIDGESFGEVLKSMFYGSLAGCALGATFNVAGKLFNGIAGNIKIKLTKKTADFLDENQVVVAGKTALKSDDTIKDSSKYVAKKSLNNHINDIKTTKEQFFDVAKKNLPDPNNKSFSFLDVSGNRVNDRIKDGYIQLTDDAPNTLKTAMKTMKGEAVDKIPVKNYIPDFDVFGYPSVKIPNFTTDMKLNFKQADELLAVSWSKNAAQIPDDCLKYIADNGLDISNLKASDIVNIRSAVGYTWHEKTDMKTLLFMPRNIHNRTLGGINHFGGRGLLKLVKQNSLGKLKIKHFVKKYVK